MSLVFKAKPDEHIVIPGFSLDGFPLQHPFDLIFFDKRCAAGLVTVGFPVEVFIVNFKADRMDKFLDIVHDQRPVVESRALENPDHAFSQVNQIRLGLFRHGLLVNIAGDHGRCQQADDDGRQKHQNDADIQRFDHLKTSIRYPNP
ncbi:hypothetical protein D1872_257010 [compost metagenome]